MCVREEEEEEEEGRVGGVVGRSPLGSLTVQLLTFQHFN